MDISDEGISFAMCHHQTENTFFLKGKFVPTKLNMNFMGRICTGLFNADELCSTTVT